MNFSFEDTLSYKKGGLVSIWHNDTHNKVGALAALVLTHCKAFYEPMINYGRDLTAAQSSALTRINNAAGQELKAMCWYTGCGSVAADASLTPGD